MKKLFISPFLLFVLCVAVSADGENRVVIIGIDGWTASSLSKANLPTIKRMMREGASTLSVVDELPTNSPTNWSSLFMGVSPDLHGLTSEGPMKAGYVPKYPSIFTLLRNQKPNSEIGAFYEWHKIKHLFSKGALNHSQHLPRMFDVSLTLSVAPYIKQRKPALLFFHIDATDHRGHTDGFDSPKYLRTLEKYDKKIAKIENFVKKADIFTDTVFMIVTDHGGKGLHHGGDSPEERYTPLVVYGKNIKKDHIIEREVKIEDISATIAFILGVEPPEEWIGMPIDEIFVEN
ncbi:MAG: alkaline phosphatase [Treponema sp.]|jgi:predicted AlkP superfamily pyrophosphatase or phosphodiesterase|nr:alkaline phosphatase [Treponema sp.]